MLTAPGNSPEWAQDFAKDIEADLNARFQSIPRVPFFQLAALPSAAAAWSSKTGMAMTGLIGVQATAGPTICLSDGTNWIDLQTGSAVA